MPAYPDYDEHLRPRQGFFVLRFNRFRGGGQYNGSNGFISTIHELKSDLYKPSCPTATRRDVAATPSGMGNLISTLLLTIIRLHPLMIRGL